MLCALENQEFGTYWNNWGSWNGEGLFVFHLGTYLVLTTYSLYLSVGLVLFFGDTSTLTLEGAVFVLLFFSAIANSEQTQCTCLCCIHCHLLVSSQQSLFLLHLPPQF